MVIERCLPSFWPDWSILGSVPAKATNALADLNLSTLDTSAINLAAVFIPIPGIEMIDFLNIFFDSYSDYLSGGLEAGLAYFGPEGFGFKGLGKYLFVLKKIGIGMIIADNVISCVSSIVNNFNNLNYTTGEAIGASFMDAAYYTGKAFGTYRLGNKVSNFAIKAGMTAGTVAVGLSYAIGLGATGMLITGIAVGGLVAIGIGVAGAVAIYYIGEGADYLYGEFKRWLFE